MTNNKIINDLNDLLTRSFDAAEGYDLAAENAENEIMVDFFKKHATDRRRFIAELTTQIALMDGEPVDSGSFKASLHRTWMNIKEAITTNETEKMIEEAVRGEEAAIAEYTEILDRNDVLPPTINTLLRNQRDEIKNALDILKGMLAEVY